MPRTNKFEFEIFRMNVVNEIGPDDMLGGRITKDIDILGVLKTASSAAYDFEQVTPTARYRWSIREVTLFREDGVAPSSQVVGLTYSRSTVQQQGETVTDDGVTATRSEITPPLSTSIRLFFHMERHMVAVECDAVLLASGMWRKNFQAITKGACQANNFYASILLEPLPQTNEILSTFKSFSKIRRLRVKLLLPNPELTRRTKSLYDDMKEGGIREYLQDMHNADGISKSEDMLPYATVSMAQQGYKDGEVLIEGVRGGKSESVRTGLHAARTAIDTLKDYVRGMHATARTVEAQRVTQEIIGEIDRIAPVEQEETP